MPIHIVQKGECLSSIAFKKGFFPETIWEDPNNASLKDLRKDPNILLEGDKVFIPEKGKKSKNISSDKRCKFQMKGVPARLQLTILDQDHNPIKNEHYYLYFNDKLVSSKKLSDSGLLDEPIPPDLKEALLFIGSQKNPMIFSLFLGELDPIDSTNGILSRLNSLGFKCEENNINTAVVQFQKKYKLKEGGNIKDKEFIDKLKQVSGR